MKTKSQRNTELDPKELAFIEAVTSLDENGRLRSLEEAAVASGYSYQYARHLRHKPKIAAAINERCAELEAENTEATQVILRRLAVEAAAGNVKAAAVFLRAVGRGGASVSVTTQVTTGGESGLEERLSDFHRRRFAVSEN